MTEHLCDFAFSVLYVHEQLHYTYVYLYLDFNYKDSTPSKTFIALLGFPRFMSVVLSFPVEPKLELFNCFTLSLTAKGCHY